MTTEVCGKERWTAAGVSTGAGAVAAGRCGWEVADQPAWAGAQ